MTKPKAGAFTASCAVAHGKKEFDDPALFEAHLLTARKATPGMAVKRETWKDKHGGHIRYGKILGWTHRSGTFKRLTLWRAPRLIEAGKAFAPAGLEPGATVTWKECVDHEWVERSGQVWCEGWRPRSAWVVPFERRVDAQGHLEQAVMVEQRRKESPDLEHYSTQWSSVFPEPQAVPA